MDRDDAHVRPAASQPAALYAIIAEAVNQAMSSLLTLRPRLQMSAVRVLQRGGLALAHGRWRLTVIDDGSRIELTGLGAMVSRRGTDGAWRVLLDDPLIGP